MSDTQKIVDTLTDAWVSVGSLRALLITLPEDELASMKSVFDMLRAIDNIIDRRMLAHSNALEVQS